MGGEKTLEDLTHPDLEKLAKKLGKEPWEIARAAVAVMIKPTQSDLELFLAKRAEADDDPWSGDVAFPGGKKTPQDVDLVATVVREVMEETGIDLRGVKPLGFMEPLYSMVRKDLAVQPVIYVLDNYPRVRLNYELTRFFWVGLEELRKGRSEASVKGWEGPVFMVQGEVVWGLTYRMLEKLLSLLEED